MTSDSEFVQHIQEEMEASLAIISAHSNDGENRVVDISSMFPRGLPDVLFVIWQKTGRALGYDRAGNLVKVHDELQDILNYAAMALTWYSLATLSEEGTPKK